MLLSIKNNLYIKLLDELNTSNLLEGAIEVLDKLKFKGVKIAIGSSSKNARGILEKLGLTHYFHSIIDGTNISHSKPDPEVFVKAAESLGLSKNSCVVVEDSLAGIESAFNAQIKSYYLNGEDIKALNAQKITSLLELLEDI
jgi:beta-phosphoglucomutase